MFIFNFVIYCISYTIFIITSKNTISLFSFIKLFDYMTNYMLYRLTKRSNYMLADMLRIHVNFTPSRELLEGSALDEVLEVLPRQTDTCKVCIGSLL